MVVCVCVVVDYVDCIVVVYVGYYVEVMWFVEDEVCVVVDGIGDEVMEVVV